MKLTKRVKALVSVVLVLLMTVSVMTVGVVAASGADALTLQYSFAYKNSGYAQGKLKLSAASSAYGTYYLYWADDTKALDGYAEITKMTLSATNSFRSFTFGEFTAIPAGATKIIAIKSTSAPTTKTVASAAAVYNIPASKQFKHKPSEVKYNFQALSDVHVHKQDPPYYPYSEQHLGNALSAAAKRDAEFVTICGDMINGYGNLYTKEWAAYLKVIADSPFCNPIYETNGNHETKSDSKSDPDAPYTTGINTYKAATGMNVTTGKMPSQSYYEITAPNGDHFIFMVLELNSSPNESNEFTAAQMTWLKGLLSKYYGDGHNIFLYEHALISGYGAGDNEAAPFYGGSLQQSYPVVKEFISLLEKYPDIFWLSGHTHIDFKYGYNFSNRGGTTAYTVHIPSTSSTNHPNNSGGLDYIMSEDSSQGYFVDVYSDAVVFNGTDMVKNNYLPSYIYFVDKTKEKLIPNNDIPDDDNYPTASVNVDVHYLAPDPEYVYCYAYDSSDSLENNGYPGVAMTKNADGTFSCKISTQYDKMMFVFSDKTLGKLGSDQYDVNNCKVVIGADKIVYNNPNGWTNLHTYVWSDSNTSFTWPGLLMTKDSATGEYYAYVPADTFDKVIFNNGGGDKKTGDLDLKPYLNGSIKGSYTVTAPIERPTTPADNTEPSTAATVPTTTPAVTETQPTTAAETEPTTATTVPVTEPPVEKLLYGDANEDGSVNVKDATTIQKSAADLIVLSDKAKKLADVSGDGNVNVIDATYIQKLCASLIVRFPVQIEAYALAEVGASASELSTLIADVKKTLADEYKYASYDAYMALKKAYYNYKDKTVSSMSANEVNAACTEINKALADYNTMKSNNPGLSGISGGSSSSGNADMITVYFSNAQNWEGDTMYIHYWGGSSATSWPGKEMTFVRTNSSGQAIYKCEIPGNTTGIVFHNNKGKQTVDVTTDIVDGKGFYASSASGSKWNVTAYNYG